MKPKRNSVAFLMAALLVLFLSNGCASREVIYNDPILLLSDHYWINNDVLQIQVESSSDESIPYSTRRSQSCAAAKKKISSVVAEKYPDLAPLKYKTVLYKTLNTEKNNCRLVVHIHLKNLKKILKEG